MNILHVLSQFEVTGAEAYAVTLIEEQLRSGHIPTVVSDTLTLTTRAAYVQMPIGQRSYPQRIRNILALVRLIRKRSIDIVHANSRAASWVSWFATRITRTGFVSTIHGRQHIHASSTTFNVYGKSIVVISSSLKDHLVHDLHLPARSIHVIPNCILWEWWDSQVASAQQKISDQDRKNDVILFVGRLTGTKGDIVRTMLRAVLPIILQQRSVRFRTVGGMITTKEIPPLVEDLNFAFGRQIAELRGFQSNPAAEMLQARVVIGSGRVVPEALYVGKQALAFGETDYVGPVTLDTFDEAATTNFGDTGEHRPIDVNKIARELLALVEQPPSAEQQKELARLARARFESRTVCNAILGVYGQALAHARSPRSIPVLMYHRVLPDSANAPAHGIWIRESTFAHQLDSLQRRGFETITFRDYSEFLDGKKPLPHRPVILTFDDGYVDNYACAFPLLQKVGFRAVIYTVTDSERRMNFWDTDDITAPLMTVAQMKELHHAGIEFGSHTVTHPRLPDIDQESVRRELVTSKQHIEEMLGSEVLSFAYPYGALNSSVKKMVAEAGYKFAVAADSGPLMFHEDFLEIRRTQVFPWTGTAGFWKKTLPLYKRYKRMKS